MTAITFPEVRRSARRLAFTAQIAGTALCALVALGVVAGASAAFGASPRDMAARQVISESCGLRAPFSPSQLDNAFPSSQARRAAVDSSRARFQHLSIHQKRDICDTARAKGFRR